MSVEEIAEQKTNEGKLIFLGNIGLMLDMPPGEELRESMRIAGLNHAGIRVPLQRTPEYVELYKQLFYHLGRQTKYADNFSTFVQAIYQRYLNWRKTGMRKPFSPLDRSLRQRPVVTFVSVRKAPYNPENPSKKYEPDIFYDAAFVSEKYSIPQDFFLRTRMRTHFPRMAEQDKDELVTRVMNEIAPRQLPKVELKRGTLPYVRGQGYEHTHRQIVRRMRQEMRDANTWNNPQDKKD